MSDELYMDGWKVNGMSHSYFFFLSLLLSTLSLSSSHSVWGHLDSGGVYSLKVKVNYSLGTCTTKAASVEWMNGVCVLWQTKEKKIICIILKLYYYGNILVLIYSGHPNVFGLWHLKMYEFHCFRIGKQMIWDIYLELTYFFLALYKFVTKTIFSKTHKDSHAHTHRVRQASSCRGVNRL